MTTNELMKERIERTSDIIFTKRTSNILKREKVETIEELISLTEEDLRNFKGSGDRTVREVKDCLRGHHISLTPFPLKKLSLAELNTLKILISTQLKELGNN